MTDINHPITVATIGLVGPPKFVNASEVSFESDGGLVRQAVSGSPKMIVAPAGTDFDWSPLGTTAVYVIYKSSTDGGTIGELHTVSSGQDKVFASGLQGPPLVWGCESQQCADGTSTHLAYSPWGDFISWGQSLRPSFRLWTSDGVQPYPFQYPLVPSMEVWSDGDLYFSDSSGVERYRDKSIAQVLPGVAWIRPQASPGGGQIVYELRDSGGVARVYLLTTASGSVREVAKGRSEPAFLTARYLWYRGERSCTAADQCPTGTTVFNGKTYLYDLQTGVEYPSIITNVYDVWPHKGDVIQSLR